MERTWMRGIAAGAVALLLSTAPFAAAQDADELAKQTQNPVASLISVPLQGNWDFGLGDRDATGTLLNIQPVMPFGISKSTNVILRVIMPLTSQPGIGRASRVNGLGDIVATAFFSPAKSGRIIWGVGPVFLLPAATNNALGSREVRPRSVGRRADAARASGRSASSTTRSGRSAAPTIATTSTRLFLQPFANYNLGGGLSVGVSIEAIARTGKPTRRGRRRCSSASARSTLLGKRPVSFVGWPPGPTVASPEAGAELAVPSVRPRSCFHAESRHRERAS